MDGAWVAMAQGLRRLEEDEGRLEWFRQAHGDRFVGKDLYPALTDGTWIFRYVQSSTFLSMIEHYSHEAGCVQAENWLAHISRWDDPFEGFVFRGGGKAEEKINDVSGGRSLRDLYRNYFGQSWTLCGKESDLRWRSYCPNGDGVRIKSSIGRLKKSLIRKSRHSVSNACCFSRVYYYPVDELKKVIEERGDDVGVEMLFRKSFEFSDEREYRVIVDGVLLQEALRNTNKKMRIESGFLKYALQNGGDSNTLQLFDEILLDPRMPTLDVERLKSRIAQTGLRCTVKQSEIYKW